MVLGIGPTRPRHAAVNLFSIGINAGTFNTGYGLLITVFDTWSDLRILAEAPDPIFFTEFKY